MSEVISGAPSEEEIPIETSALRIRRAMRRTYNATVVTAAGASLVFEQSPANEAIRINWGLDVLKHTQSAPAVGVAIFGITAAIEGVSSGLITAGLHTKGGMVQKLKDKMQKKYESDGEIVDSEDEPPDTVSDSNKIKKIIGKTASVGADTGIALGLGAGLVTVKHHIMDENPTVAKDIKTSAKATAMVSGVSGTIGYLAGGGIANAAKLGLETPAQYVIDYGTDTKFWMGALAVGYGAVYAKKGIKRIMRRKDSDNNPEQQQSQDIDSEEMI